MSRTPGPYSITGPSEKRLPFDAGGDYVIRTADGRIIAETFHNTASHIYDDALANAQLFAAALDMEDVCNKVASHPVEIQEMMRREDIVLDNLDNRMQKFAFTLYTMLATDAGQAERAIAKAKGD